METRVNKNMTKKQLFNAESASRSITEAIDEGLVFEIVGVAVILNGGKSKNGTPCDVGYIATANDGVFGFTSNVILNHIETLADILDDPEPVNARFIAGTTKDGTEFYSIELI